MPVNHRDSRDIILIWAFFRHLFLVFFSRKVREVGLKCTQVRPPSGNQTF